MVPPNANAYSPTWFELYLSDFDQAQTERKVAFLMRNLPEPPSAVLDVCCGYGRHAAPLAGAGYEVLGIDREAAAIGYARSLHRSERLTFLVHDMTRLGELPGTFDAATCLWQSFGYHDAPTNADALRQMADHLRLGGRLVLDLYNRGFFEIRQGERETTQRGERIITRQRLDGDRLIVDLNYIDRSERERFDWQVFTPETIAMIAEGCALRFVRACTGFDERVPPTPDQPRMQLIFERR